jgi:hypothetical protein
MTNLQALQLIRQPNKWKRVPSIFTDKLQTKDGKIWFFANEAICFRSTITDETILKVNIFIWPLFRFFSHRLDKRVPTYENILL